MAGFAEKLKVRVPSLRRFIARARDDSRAMAYDLLPVLGLEARDRVSETCAAFSPRTAQFRPSDKARGFHDALKHQGLTAPQGPLPGDVVHDMVDYFQTTLCHDPYRPQLGRFQWDAPPSPEVNLGYFTWEEVIRAPHLLDLANHPDVLQAAELWLGCKPTIDNIGASWSYPGRDTAKGAQRFHRDFDCSRSFKLFLYLSDVDEETGPHTFVRGSNRMPRLESARAQTDETIIETFGEDAITRITAPAGSWFLEDVYGFHKGGVPRSKPRLLVGIEYNLYPSPLSPKAPILPRDARYDPYINRLFLAS